MKYTFNKIYKSMPDYLRVELYDKGWNGSMHISDDSGVTVIEFVPTYTKNNVLIPINTTMIPSVEKIKSEIEAFESGCVAIENRKKEYPSIEELVVALYDSEDKAEIDRRRAEIKNKYPKP